MAAQSDDQTDATVQTTKTTTTTVQHVNGANTTWYMEDGIVPTEYRDNRYVVQQWQTEHLNEPSHGSHWVRGDNGDYLLVDESTGAIAKHRLTHQVHAPSPRRLQTDPWFPWIRFLWRRSIHTWPRFSSVRFTSYLR